MWEWGDAWGLPQAEEKGWAVSSTSAEQPVIKDNRIEKGLLKRLQFSEILLREMIAMFNVEV